MITFPQNFESKIGFDIIKQNIEALCLSSLGIDLIYDLRASDDFLDIERKLVETTEFVKICTLHSDFPTDNFLDLRNTLKILFTEGTHISTDALLKFMLSQKTVNRIIAFFKNEEEFRELKNKSSKYFPCEYIVQRSSDIIDENGEVKDNASEELYILRKTKKQLLKSREKKIENIYAMWQKSGHASDIGITIRNARLVIPVFAASKRQVKGFIFDESATGQIVYMEPTELFDINNEIADIENAEKKEILRLLTSFADYIRPHLNELIENYELLGLIDFIRAKALFSLKMKAVKPFLENKPYLRWNLARHPLLLLKNIKTPYKVIPQDITLDENQRVLIISGPNSGGKSVCLKTVGLLQYMIQCGLLIPVEEGSVCGIFKKICIEIGDEQSLENELSTYSSHLKNLSFFLHEANPNSLFLIDELGSGTEPQMGGAIAEAILEGLYEKKAFGIVTTHYTNLKVLPQKHDAMKNAAMLFDIKTLTPLYKLLIGEQGSSFAFEIARKIGLPHSLIDKAKEKSGIPIAGIEESYFKIKEQEKELKDRMAYIEKSDAALNEVYEKYATLLNQLELEKSNIINKAKEEAAILISEANKKIEHVIKSIKENQAQQEITKLLRNELKDYEQSLKTEEVKKDLINKTIFSEENIKKKTKHIKKEFSYQIDFSGAPLNKGDFVIMQGQEEVGIVEELKGNIIYAVFGSLRIKTKADKLKRVINYKPPIIKNNLGSEFINKIFEKKKNFLTVLDLRGKRAEEALRILDDYIHEAVLCGVSPVKILHGKGDGILRPIIRKSLSNHAFVCDYHDEILELGGQGITVVNLNF